VRVISVFEAHGTAYMVMRFESGQSLKAWLAGIGRLPTQAELDNLVEPLLIALELMHAADFLHRDIAPDNIMIRPDGSPVLLDFGASRRVLPQLSASLTGVVKQGYSPQEQYSSDGRSQGPWTDIYAFGATLYRAVTGETPLEATARMLDDGMAPASVAAAGHFLPGFLAAIDAAMRLHPRDRPQSIAEWRPQLLPASARSLGEPGRPGLGVGGRPGERTGPVSLPPERTSGPSAASVASGQPAPMPSDDIVVTAPPPAIERRGIDRVIKPLGVVGLLAVAAGLVASGIAMRSALDWWSGLAQRRPAMSMPVAKQPPPADVERELRRLEAGRQREADAASQREAEARRKAEEIRRAEEERQRQAAEAEARRKAAEARQAELERQRTADEERQRQAAEAEARRKAEEARRAELERQKAAETERQRQAAEAEARRKAEETRRAEEERQRQATEAEARRKAEEARLAELERQKAAEEERQRQAAEAEARRKAEETRRAEEERQRQAAEAEARRKAEEARRAEEERQRAAAAEADLKRLRDAYSRCDAQNAKSATVQAQQFDGRISAEVRLQINLVLKRRGLLDGEPDRAFGAASRKAIRKFQTELGATETGYLTACQLDALIRS
jgi:hypothetical protein